MPAQVEIQPTSSKLIELPMRTSQVVTVEAPILAPPFSVDALALEEDTSLILSADTSARETDEHPIRLMTDLYFSSEKSPGTVIARRGKPPRLLAVVHDLDTDPTTKAEWISAALVNVMQKTSVAGWQRLGIDPLGAVHGRFPLQEFRSLLEAAIQSRPADSKLTRVWVRIPDRLTG